MMRLATELAGRHCFWGAGPMARLQSLAELLERAMERERERERERQKNTGNVWTCKLHLENYVNAWESIYIYMCVCVKCRDMDMKKNICGNVLDIF
jgi:hypothetical protein